MPILNNAFKACEYFIIAKIIKHLHRYGKIGYKIILPNGEYIVIASSNQLVHYQIPGEK